MTIDFSNPRCQCVGKHIPKPMQLLPYYVLPLEDGGEDSGSNIVWLCPTTHFNVSGLWEMYEEGGGRPHWSVLREYSEFARNLVERGREMRRRIEDATA